MFVEKIKVSYLCLASTADSSVIRLVLRAQLNRTDAVPTELSHVQNKVETRDKTSLLVRGTETGQGMDGAKLSSMI
jgi:hypothetical protein